ncbi:MAG: hypothetical protein NTX71_04040 [Candidatus Aureabacteria bacterium]|nr:hypothetical protein [Candidatus Auribacterota bacterium]
MFHQFPGEANGEPAGGDKSGQPSEQRRHDQGATTPRDAVDPPQQYRDRAGEGATQQSADNSPEDAMPRRDAVRPDAALCGLIDQYGATESLMAQLLQCPDRVLFAQIKTEQNNLFRHIFRLSPCEPAIV